ncbi:P-loop containing nucleoside triphosphate hydrolase protein [Scheffersomyces coipomensis]|uniref:P-loop containing nucleoside triphosphate hydrolase protein n=1 Tax=Scheffersomyces coipomensis TaxID=1788519 RepID=UPI00315D264E
MKNQIVSYNTTFKVCSLDAITHPFSGGFQNSFNPCFLSSLSLMLNTILGCFALFQFIWLIRNNKHGPFKIQFAFGSYLRFKSVGIIQIFKVGLVGISLLSFILLSFISSSPASKLGPGSSIIAIGFIILPLHISEPTRSVIPCASLLLFWLISSLFNLVVLVQDIFSDHKIYIAGDSNVSLIITIEVLQFVISVLILVTENAYYTATQELKEYYDLNDWERSTVKSLFTEVSFSWASNHIGIIYQSNTLDIKILPKIPIDFKVKISYEKLLKHWNNFKNSASEENPSLFYVIVITHWFHALIGFCLDIMEVLFGFAQAFMLQQFILLFNEVSSSTSPDFSKPILVGFCIATCLFTCAVFRYFTVNRYYSNYYSMKCKIQGSLTDMVYKKALNLSPEARKGKTTGEIVNNISIDVGKLADIPHFVELATGPIKLLLTLYALFKIIGVSTISGFIAACILVPTTTKVSTSITSLYNQIMSIRDERTKLISEILTSIKSIKLYSWEDPMSERLSEIRNDRELPLGRKIGVFNALSMFLWSLIPFFIPCACLITYSYISPIPLVPSTCFPALSLFGILAKPILFLPDIFAQAVECKVSLKRLQDLLALEELDTSTVHRTSYELKNNDISIEVRNATFHWDNKKETVNEHEVETSDIALKNINFSARKGNLNCIVGRVGSGKTSFLRSLLGEIPLYKKPDTLIGVNGSIAYCAQSPWILNATVKQNILFGFKYDKVFYKRTIEACQLLPDLEILPDGDKTVVGEKGISLSGGQKARLALARAVYARADVYLLDDVLSAVDAHVAKNLIDKVLGPEGLLSTKTIVLATNAIGILHKAQNIILLQKGEIIASGSYNEIINQDNKLTELIKEFGQIQPQVIIDEPSVVVEDTEFVSDDEIIKLVPSNAGDLVVEDSDFEPLEVIGSRASHRRASIVSFTHDEEDDDEDNDLIIKTGDNAEKGPTGDIKFSVHLQYFKACNIWSIIFYVFTYIGSMSTLLMANYVLKVWSEKNLQVGFNVSPIYYLTTYAALGISSGLFILIGCSVVCIFSVIKASRYFHASMFHSILRSPMSFFETTPTGRILNRFSDDINVLDDQLIWSWIGLTHYIIESFGLLGVLIFNLPPMALVILVFFFLFNSIRKYFIPAGRELKRLVSASRSPIFSHVQESIIGVETIRAFDQQERFIFKNESNAENLISAMYSSLFTSRWLSFRLQMMSAIMMYATTLMILFTAGRSNSISPGLVGFLMINVLSITGLLNSIIRCWAEVETKSVAVERIIEYCKLKPEAELIIKDSRPPESWPQNGSIEFKNYSTKYRDNLDPVLHNLNISIKPMEKIGIVGRTGAGKSTIAVSLFRIIESVTGNIEIDGINTSRIGLFDLRHKLNIIPQDAQTIEGSIRQNLDPLGSHSDAELWEVLDHAHMKEHVLQMKTKKDQKDENVDDTDIEYDTGLSAAVFEGGSNLSSGQKQLLSLARALLNKSQILILDEATAAVDVQTDKIIQETIRSEFKDKTILTIAHRLETILDNDRIIVLDKGKVKEFDTPQNLLGDTSSEFYSLCNQAAVLKTQN